MKTLSKPGPWTTNGTFAVDQKNQYGNQIQDQAIVEPRIVEAYSIAVIGGGVET
jgi:hypothetical protein